MPIVARAARSRSRGAAAATPSALLAAVLALSACNPAPAATPAGSASPSVASAASLPAATPAGAPGSACVTPAAPERHDWNERVWYEVFVRSFKDSNGDGIGDFR